MTSITNKALFAIERNAGHALSLDAIAAACVVSRFHLAHAFGEATGLSVMDYVRGRRLTDAARALAAGADDILQLALGSGYGSHQAFSRAFKARFGAAPEAVRKAKSTRALRLVDPLPHLDPKPMTLKEPRIEHEGELLFVGRAEAVSFSATQVIPNLWARFMSGPYGHIGHRLDEPPTGLAIPSDDDGFRYMCAARVSSVGDLPEDCAARKVAPATYVVFAHDGHASVIRQTYDAIWNDWFPASGKTPARQPSLERHNPSFDPRTGEGGVMIWIPIQA